MWGWLFGFLALTLLLYLFFLKRELRKLTYKAKEIPISAGYGSKLYVDFREKSLMQLVDELNQMIEAFEQKNRQAKQMEENVRLSIAGLSHDLRTPLTSIHGYIQLLHATADETKKVQYLTIIEHSVRRLMEMADRFYDLARIETNQKEIVLSSLSLSSLVEETFLSFYEQFEEKKIELQFPEQAVNTPIIADSVMLVRVIQNIVQNMLRYADSKAIVRYEPDDRYLLFSVSNDIKPGSKVAIEKVFERFYTEDASRTNTESSGLGLYLSKKLVEKMNGKMNARMKDNWFILEIHFAVHRI
ncbi:sensor histidine kinase [Paenibacillus contaminans]|uniref:histidine kinase n=1 Tax=Paenibacillus contaminans TaxID=450362 RepID=A0A329MYV0_9BACL|nr:HAMP domain-containing sensor histidine kinase [Paenibacillus contaminans]RAV23383.1 sensor histidine kinase [Paenibacillus contaminans]